MMRFDDKAEGNYNKHNIMCWDLPVRSIDFKSGHIELGSDFPSSNSIAEVCVINNGVFNMDDICRMKKMRVTVELVIPQKGELDGHDEG